jgi:hypothetical protein
LLVPLGSALLPSAAAADYTVEVCTAASSGGDGLTYTEQNPGSIFLKRCGETAPGTILVGSPLGGREEPGASAFWELTAPAATRIEEINFKALGIPSNPGEPGQPASFLEWFFLAENQVVEHERDEGSRHFEPDLSVKFKPHTRTVAGGLFCVDTIPCGNGGSFEVRIERLSVQLGDGVTPGFSNVTLPPSVAHGTVPVGITAEDEGSGIDKVELRVDGQLVATAKDQNNGRCQTPYRFLQPCQLKFPASFALDTSKLKDGQHQLRFVESDAAGLAKETPEVSFLVHNAPIGLSRPLIEGSARVGSPLKATRGSWDNSPTSYAYQWFRCPVSVKGERSELKACRSIAGATDPQYTPVQDDLGQRDLVQVTAANATGPEASVSFPTDAVQEAPPPPLVGKKKPVLSHVTLSRKRFRVGSILKSHQGALLAFSCSRPGHLSIAIEKARKGGQPKVLGKLAASIKAGRSKLVLTGELGTRRLRPGAYRVTIQVKGNNGALSDPVGVPFAILPG